RPRRDRPRRRPPAGLRPRRGRVDRRAGAAVSGRGRGRGRPVSAIRVEDLRKSYGEDEALRGISFEIEEGEVFGLLGPNGAGKTTTVEILEGYRKRDGGEVEVLGFDPQRSERSFRERIGVVLQSSELWSTLTPLETLRMFAGYYPRPRAVDEVLDLVGLDDKRDARVRT